MERPQCLFQVLSFLCCVVIGNPAHGRIQIRGGHHSPPEDVVSFDTECKCNRNEKMIVSVESDRLPGLKGIAGVSDIMFDYSVTNCDGKITYSPSNTTFEFQIDEECGVYLAEGAQKVPTYRAYEFEGYIMQAQLDFYYIDNTGIQPRSQFLTADVNCVCPQELSGTEKDSCTIDQEDSLRFIRTETIHCQDFITSAEETVENFCEDFSIKESEHGCYSISTITDTDITVDFDFDVTDENCLGQTAEMDTESVSTSIDHISFMEINLHLPLIKAIKVNQPFLSTNNSSTNDKTMRLEYTQDWTQTYTCAKLPHWSEFSLESDCQAPCGHGKSYRRRICHNGVAGAPGCLGSSIEASDCIAAKETCDSPCPSLTTSTGEFCICDEESNRIWVLLPISLVKEGVVLDDNDVFLQGFQNHVIADLIVSGNQINFYYEPADTYLMDFSPRISNPEVIMASFSSWSQIMTLRSSDFGSGEEVTLSLQRLVKFSSSFGDVPSQKTFTGMDISKQYRNTVEFNIAANLKWITGDGTEVGLQKELTQGHDWCLAIPNNFPSSYEPVDIDDITDECPEVPEPVDCDDQPFCEIRPGENAIFTDYVCDGCRIRKTECDLDGNPDGTVSYYFPSHGSYEQILSDWNARGGSFAKLDKCKKFIEDDANCPDCSEDQLPQWSEWSKCTSVCGKGERTRMRSFDEVKDCDPGFASTDQEEECTGEMFYEREMLSVEEFNTLLDSYPGLIPDKFTKRECSNPFCDESDTKIVSKVVEVDDLCFGTEEEESCQYCCEVLPPTPEEFDEVPCQPKGDCKTGLKTITKKSECENVGYTEDIYMTCTNFEVETFCQCPSDLNDLTCEDVETDGECAFNNHSNQWVKLAYTCNIFEKGVSTMTCDGTETCRPKECVKGVEKTNCCEDLEVRDPTTGDQCVETTRKCYDKDGNETYGVTGCPGCKTNVCDADSIKECTAEQVDKCREQMGGELYCDGRLPNCESEQQIKCDLDKRESCKYKISCDCDAYKCTDKAFSIEGVNREFLNKLKYRTNDLHVTYGKDLNFFIGGGSKMAHRTEGCFHHYRSEESEAEDGINLKYMFDDLEEKCGITIPDDNRLKPLPPLNVTVWVDDASHKSDYYATATPFAHVICQVLHDVNQPPPKNVTSLMRFKPFEFIKVRKFEHDLSFDISTDPGFNELLEHRELQNLVLVGDRMYARIRSNGENDEDLKIKVVQCTVKKVNNQDLSLDFIQDGCHSKDVEEFDFKFGQKGYENGAGNEIRFEWTNFVWRGFTNIQGDESTTGREEQQYSCDVEICGRNQDCTPSCAKRTINAGGKRKRRNVPEFDALEMKEDEGVDFELEVFRTEAELRKRYQEILAEHVKSGDEVDLLLSKAMVTLAACVTVAVGLVGISVGYRQFKPTKENSGLTARIFRRFPPMDPPKYSINPTLKIDSLSDAVDYASTEVADFVTTRSNKSV